MDAMMEIDGATEMLNYTKGEEIFKSNEENQIYLIKEGRVKILTHNDNGGQAMVKDVIYPGQILGAIKTDAHDSLKASAIAMDPQVIICVAESTVFQDLMTRHADVGLAMTLNVGDRLQQLERKLDMLLFKDAPARIAAFVLNLVEEHGDKSNAQWTLTHNLTHQDIANMTATSRQTVTTVLNDLNNRGLIDHRGKTFTVFEPEGLRAYS